MFSMNAVAKHPFGTARGLLFRLAQVVIIVDDLNGDSGRWITHCVWNA
jgi:hypothetical protein